MRLELPDLQGFTSYKAYLKEVLRLNRNVRGINQVLADTMRCHRTLLSRVLNGDEHISIEALMNLCESQSLNPADTDYLVDLLLLERASQPNLKAHLKRRLEIRRASRSQAKARVLEKGSEESRATELYYRSWIPSAVHVLTSVEGGASANRIAQRLGLNEAYVLSVLQSLENEGMVRRDRETWHYAGPSIHLGKDSPTYLPFYQSWSDRALASLVGPTRDESMHFTAVISVSKASHAAIQERLLRTIEDVQATLAESSDEDDVRCLRIAFFAP